MSILFCLESARSLEDLAKPAVLVSEIAKLLEYKSDEEFMALSGLAATVVSRGVFWPGKFDGDPYSPVDLYPSEDGEATVTIEVSVDDNLLKSLPVSIQARFDQEVAETIDGQ